MLVAPAGYGKTTLAEQWVLRDDRRGTWFTARRSSTDVAGLALGVAQAASAFVPGCDARLREHLRAVPNPGGHVDVLAEILGEELAGWQDGHWLVLDEYQELVASREAERFVAELLAASPINLLVASRQRPSWVTARSILYGEVLELNQTVLAMDSREAAEMLAGRSMQSASGLVALANGWPAVIALASVSSAELEGEDEVPQSLYHFFAEEVFAALGEEVRSGLATLAIAPMLDRELAGELLGPERAEPVLSAALEVGILVEHDARLEIHPLARAFLEERSEHLAHVADPDTIATCLAYYRARRDWDAAFDLIARRGPTEELESLLREALDELLDTARLQTIETWCKFASTPGSGGPGFAIARAEVALRYGRHAEAQAFAEVAASAAPDLSFRALSLAGRAAHLASREEDGLQLYRRAEVVATTKAERRDALWGQLLCALELELAETPETLENLRTGALTDAREVLRAAAYELGYQVKFGSLDLTDAEVAYQLVGAVSDPLVTTSFQNVYGHVLGLSARYDEALEVANALLVSARKYRLDFALPYGLTSAAVGEAGLRRWEYAGAHLDEASAVSRMSRNAHAEQVCYAVRVRVLAQQGKHRAALSLELPRLRPSLPAIRAEVLSCRALVLGVAGRVDEASALIDEIRASTRAIEPTVLISAVDALASLKRREREALDLVAALEDTAFRTGALDLLVTAYRASPELLATLLRSSGDPERLGMLMRRVGDEDLAQAVGHPVVLSDDDQRQRLSPREREVYELLCQGLSNRQIAEALFISESTVKLHAHHVYDKLGTRSRTALAIQAALERAAQATSATGDSTTEAS